MTPLRNVHKLSCMRSPAGPLLSVNICNHEFSRLRCLRWTFICYGKCSQLCATSTHLVSTKSDLTSMCHAFCESPCTHQRVIGPSTSNWWVINPPSLGYKIILYKNHSTLPTHSVILFPVSVDSWLDAQVRSDWGRVILRKSKQRLDLRALQRPLLGSNPFI